MRLPAHPSIPIWLLLVSTVIAQAQIVTPSNNSQDLYPLATSPRFLLNGTEIPDLPPIRLAPVGNYARMSHNAFVDVEVDGHLLNVDTSNVNEIGKPSQPDNSFAYLSCDPEAYTGNLDASDVFRLAVNQPRANIVILYSETSDHCAVQGLDSLPAINGILTTTEAMAATMLANLGLTQDSEGDVTILPDLNAYTNSSSESGFSNGLGQSPTTAVAMIILYSITGIITALFVVIIVTGAIRAHRHPERYGPRTIIGGRGRQSRARGIARAMLDTLPIVKFGDRLEPHATPKDPNTADVEMNNSPNKEQPRGDANSANDTNADADHPGHAHAAGGAAQHDGTDEEGHLGCSICTEDFRKGEEVRVLPCNHKFHPDCVDPWLLNVSGTCPLCRIDLRPQAEEATAEEDGVLPPPLGGRRESTAEVTQVENGPSSLRRDTITQLRRLAAGSNEDRIAALRRYRLERRPRGTMPDQDEGERGGLARRLRERFRVRTERRGTMTEFDMRRGTFAGPVRGG